LDAKPKKSIQNMVKYSPPLESRENKIKLDFNERTLGPGKKVIKSLQKAIKRINYYPEYSGFSSKIARYVGVREGQILATNGSDEAIKIVFEAFMSQNGEAVIPQPSFSLFAIYAQIAGSKIKKPQYNKDFSFPTKETLKAIGEKTRIVIVCSPNNPTGTSINTQDLEKILKKTKKGVVLVDEAYFEYGGKTAVSLIKKYGNLIITRTLSKAFGLASLRIGYLISSQGIISTLQKVRSPYSVNYFAKVAAETAFANKGYMKKYVRQVKKNKIRFEKFLKKKGISYVKSDSNFLLVKLNSSKKLFLKKLENAGILVRDMKMHPMLKDYVRISIGDNKVTKKLIQSIEKILAAPVIAFDLDGTIADTSKSYDLAIQKTVEKFSGEKISAREINLVRNEKGINNDWNLTKKILEEMRIKVSLKRVINKFQKFYLGKNFGGLIKNERLILGKHKIEALAEKHCLAIVTERPRKEAEFFIKKQGIGRYFSEILCMEDIPPGKQKPAPYGLNLIKKRFASTKYVYVGDTTADAKAANRAKVKSVIILQKNKRNMKKLFLENGADKIIQNMNELERVIK